MTADPQAAALTAAHRAQQTAISATVAKQALSLWGVVDPAHVDRAWPAVSRAMSQVIAQGYAASTATAVGYLRDHAALSGVDLGRVLAAPAASAEQIETALRVTGPVAVKQAAAAGMSPTQAARAAGVRLIGSAGRLTQLGGRNTIEATIAGNDSIVGYRRVGSGRTCFFCAMLISRGAVYKTEGSAAAASGRRGNQAAGHAFHDHCHCQPEAVYTYDDEPPEVVALRQKWNDTTGGETGKAAVAKFREAYDADPDPTALPQPAIRHRDLTVLTDDELAGLLGEAGDDADVDAVLGELDRRDEVTRAERAAEAEREKRRAQAAVRREAKQTQLDDEYDRRVAAGDDPEQAYADVFGKSVERMRRDAAIAHLRDNGFQGKGFDELTRAAFRDYNEQSYLDAENATRGALLNGTAGVNETRNPRRLFDSNEAYARANASEELLAYWQEHGGRLTLADFRASLLGGSLKVRGQASWY